MLFISWQVEFVGQDGAREEDDGARDRPSTRSMDRGSVMEGCQPASTQDHPRHAPPPVSQPVIYVTAACRPGLQMSGLQSIRTACQPYPITTFQPELQGHGWEEGG